MRTSAIRFLDSVIGVPLCLVLTLHRKTKDLFRKFLRPGPKAIRKILVIKLVEQGSTVLAYPALAAGCRMAGRENVFFLVFDQNRFILDLMAVMPEENVIIIPTGGVAAMLIGTLRALWRLRRLGIDAAVDFEFFARGSAVLAYLSGAQVRVGYHSFSSEAGYRGDLMTHRLSYNPHVHVSRAYKVMFDVLGLDPEALPALDVPAEEQLPNPPIFEPAAAEVDRVRRVLSELAPGRGSGPLVLFNANCSDLLPVRRWPSGRYVELARRLLETRSDVTIVFTGTGGEAAATGRLVESVGSPRCFSMAGKTTLRELLVLYTLADVLVTNDSGPAHFAVLTPVEVVTLFGPETPVLFGAASGRNHVIWARLPCSPCVSAYNNRLSPCRNNVCMQRISVDQVFELVHELLDDKSSRR